MKTRILIIEDSFAKFFCMKNLLESHLKIPVLAKDAQGAFELLQSIKEIRPSLMLVRPTGGVTALLGMLRKRQINKRNTEITLILSPDLEESWWCEIEGHAHKPSANRPAPKTVAQSKAA
jgi:hypothetical protein